MNLREPTPTSGKRIGGPVSRLFELVRQRRERKRNLAELAKLNTVRLNDIGLTEGDRARIICPS